MKTITIKGLSEKAYAALKKCAAIEHRSLNRQVILILEQHLARQTIDVKAWLEETARLRKSWGIKPTTMKDIDADKRRGRP